MKALLASVPSCLLIGLALAGVSSPLFGQSTGGLAGVVKDPSGAAVPDALVSLYRPGMTDPANQTKTTGAGLFQFDALPPESYRVTIEKPGFALYEATDVRVSPGTETDLNGIALALGQQPTVVNAAEKLHGVQTSNAEVSTTLTTEQLDKLPILNRNPLNLVKTQAGVVQNNSPNDRFTNINGLRTSYSNVSLDGINIQDNTVRYNGLDVVPNQITVGQVSQFTLVTSNQSSVYGNGVTQTAFATPSGTNQLHGEVFYLNSNNLFNANNWFASQQDLRNSIKSNMAGGNIGGPILREKLFGYIGYEFYRGRNSIGTAWTALTPDARRTLAQLLNAPINPIVQSLLATVPTVAPANPGDLFGTYFHSVPLPSTSDNAIVRLDYVPSQRNTIVASYLWNRADFDQNTTDGVPSRFGSRSANAEHSRASLISGSWRFNPTTRLTNELRAGVNLAPIDFVNREITGPYVLNLGILDFINPISTSAGNYPQGRTLKTYDFQDNASYVFGRHNLEFGFQVQLVQVDGYVGGNTAPVITLGNPNLNVPLGDSSQFAYVLSGIIRTDVQRFFPVDRSGAFGTNPNVYAARLNNYAPYVQDNWKVTRRLALTLGLRYDYYTPLSNSKGLFYVPQLIGNPLQTIAASTQTYNLQGSNLYKADKNNFAPNIGLAFDPWGNGRTALRAAYGIAYVNDDFVESIRLTAAENAFNLGGVQRLGGVLGTTNLNLSPISSGPSIVRSGSQTVALVDPNLRTPYVQQWSAGVQQEFAGMVFYLRYVGNHATKLLRQDRFSLGNNTGWYDSNAGNSTYNAMQFDVSRRLRPDLQFQANYTFSRSLTDTAKVSSALLDPYIDQNNHRIDRGPAPWDLPHTFKANLIYDLPFGKGRSMPLRSIVGGWSLSAIAIAQSGSRFSILASNGISTANTNVGGGALSRVVSFSMTGNGPSIIALSATNLDQNSTNFGKGVGFFAGQVFFDPPSGSPGQLQPRLFAGPAAFDVDLGIQRSFRLTEHQKIELRGVAINVLNHPSFAFGDQTIGSSTFGRDGVGALYPARTIQLSAYYRF